MPSSRRLNLSPEADADLADIRQSTARAWGEEQADAYLDSVRDTPVSPARVPA